MDAKEERRVERARRRRRVVILLVFLALIIALIFLFRAVLMPFLVALFIAYLIDPVVERLAPIRTIRKFRLGRAGAIIVLYLVFLFTLYLGAKFAIPAMGEQLRMARRDLPALRNAIEGQVEKFATGWENFVGRDEKKKDEEKAEPEPENESEPEPPPEPTGIGTIFLHGGGMMRGRIVTRTETQLVVDLGGEMQLLDAGRVERIEMLREQAPDSTFDIRELAPQSLDRLVSSLDQVLGLAIKFVGLLVGTLYKMVLIMMITAFIVIDKDKILAFFRNIPPGPYKKTFQKLGVYIDHGLAGVIRGQLMICAVNGVLTWIGLAFLGVRYAGLLGLIAGVFSLIPIFGTIISSIPIVLIAWGAGSFHKGVLALGWILLIHFVEANFLNPKIMGSASKIHPVVVVFALLAGEHAYGIVGALLAVPTVSIIQSSFKFYVLDRQAEAEAEAEPAPVYP